MYKSHVSPHPAIVRYLTGICDGAEGGLVTHGLIDKEAWTLAGRAR